MVSYKALNTIIVFNLMGAKSILANLMDTTTNTFRHGILQKIAFLT